MSLLIKSRKIENPFFRFHRSFLLRDLKIPNTKDNEFCPFSPKSGLNQQTHKWITLIPASRIKLQNEDFSCQFR